MYVYTCMHLCLHVYAYKYVYFLSGPGNSDPPVAGTPSA